MNSEVWEHYTNAWGSPSRVATFRRQNEPEVRVGKWDPDQTREGVTIYATDGVSVGLDGVRLGHGYEVFAGFTPEQDQCESALAALATTARYEGLGPGDTVEADGSLWPETAMTAWLLLPQTEILSPLVTGPTHVTFVQAVPLYPHERTWKVVHGTDALMHSWQRETVPFWNPNRKPSALP